MFKEKQSQAKTITGKTSSDNEKDLREVAKELKLPISRLLGYLLDNALLNRELFNYECSLPDDEYVENAYAGEAQKIIEYMKYNTYIRGLDHLTMLRRDIGIPDKTTFLYGLRECIMQGRVIDIDPESSKYHKEFTEDYRWYVLAEEKPKPKKVRRTPEEKLYDDYLKIQKKLKAKGLLDE